MANELAALVAEWRKPLARLKALEGGICRHEANAYTACADALESAIASTPAQSGLTEAEREALDLVERLLQSSQGGDLYMKRKMLNSIIAIVRRLAALNT